MVSARRLCLRPLFMMTEEPVGERQMPLLIYEDFLDFYAVFLEKKIDIPEMKWYNFYINNKLPLVGFVMIVWLSVRSAAVYSVCLFCA